MRNHIVAGNWKMNLNAAESQKLIEDLKSKKLSSDVRVAIATPAVYLATVANQTANSKIDVAAQNMHQADSGAFTGEISASMLKSIGVHTTLLGHSERRAYFHETDELLAAKVNTALKMAWKLSFALAKNLTNANQKAILMWLLLNCETHFFI